MPPPINVVPEDLHMVAQDMRNTATDFITDKPPPIDPDEDWPSMQATSDFNQGVHNTSRHFHAQSHNTADLTDTSATLFAATDENNAAQVKQVGTQLSPKDASGMMTGVMKDLFTGASAVFNSLGTAAASMMGTLGGAVAGSVSSLAKAGGSPPPQAATAVPTSVGGVGGGNVASAGNTAPATSPAGALSPPSTTPEGGRPATEHHEEHVVSAGMPGGMGGMPTGLMGAGAGSSSDASSKPKTYKITTDYSESDPITAPIPVVEQAVVSVPEIGKAP